MAVLALATDLADMRERLGRMVRDRDFVSLCDPGQPWQPLQCVHVPDGLTLKGLTPLAASPQWQQRSGYCILLTVCFADCLTA